MIQPHCPLRAGSFFQRTPVSKSSCSNGYEHWGGCVGGESSASLPSAALQDPQVPGRSRRPGMRTANLRHFTGE